MKKESFLQLLMRDSPEEINEIIRKHGKGPKMVNAITFLDDNTYKESHKEDKNG